MSVRMSSLAVLSVFVAAAGGCGEKVEEQPEPGVTAARPPDPTDPPGGGSDEAAPGVGEEDGPPAEKPPRGESGPAEAPGADPRVTRLEREAAATVRDYVAALDARDGERVCSLLAPGAIGEVELPRPRGSCADSLEASIGYRDPRGLPVWSGAKVLEVASVKTAGSRATVVATVLSRFADRPEPSIEDDLVYLTRAGGAWVLAKPSATLYRSVGIADLPPSVLAPPRGRP